MRGKGEEGTKKAPSIVLIDRVIEMEIEQKIYWRLREIFPTLLPQEIRKSHFHLSSFFQGALCMRTCIGAHPNFGFIIDGSVAEERHNLNQEHHLAHTATPILASLLMIHQKLNWPHKKKSKARHQVPSLVKPLLANWDRQSII